MKGQRGEISVYTTCMMSVLLLLFVAVLAGVRKAEERAKCTQAFSGAIESIKGDYDKELYTRYHIFALDPTYGGKGEGYLEQRAYDYLDCNLNPANSPYEYEIEDVMLTDVSTLMEDDLYGFRKQISEYEEIKLPVTALTELETWITQVDEQADDSKIADMEATMDETEPEYMGEDTTLTKEDVDLLGFSDVLEALDITDPKDLTVRDMVQLGIQGVLRFTFPVSMFGKDHSEFVLHLVMPKEAEAMSKTWFNNRNTPSYLTGKDRESEFVNPFVMQGLESILHGDAKDMLSQISIPKAMGNYAKDELYGMAYALDAFQYAGQTLEGEHRLDYEVEYIIAGNRSDTENMAEVIGKIALIRMIPNGIYAFQSDRMRKEAEIAAAIILAPTGIGEVAVKPVSYCILALWSYGESLMDVKALVKGNTVPIIKNEENWQLSVKGLMNLLDEEPEDAKEVGLDYRAYLLFLLATTPNAELKYYRMLDVIQINMEEERESFRIEQYIYAFTLQASIREGEDEHHLTGRGTYLEEETVGAGERKEGAD